MKAAQVHWQEWTAMKGFMATMPTVIANEMI